MKSLKKVGITTLYVALGAATIVAAWAVWMLWDSFQAGKAIESRQVHNTIAAGSINNMAQEGIDPVTLATGEFMDVDLVHRGTGGVEVYALGDDVYIKLLEDFSVTQGPDLYIHLSAPQEYGGAKGASIAPTLNLGKLDKPGGEQVYMVSREEWEQYQHSILIYCRFFGVHFSHAFLTPPIN